MIILRPSRGSNFIGPSGMLEIYFMFENFEMSKILHLVTTLFKKP